jgi:SAM-dependent methyltransferase
MNQIEQPSLLKKWAYYSERYGSASACARYVGRVFPSTWRFLGRLATEGYLKRWMRQPGSKIINLGGGGNLRDEWLTADIDPHSDVFLDCTETLPIPDRSLDGIMLEEVIEHLTYPHGLKLLRECMRVLKDDGTLRVTTPDLAWFANLQTMTRQKSGNQEVEDFVHREGTHFLGCSEASEGLCRAATINYIFLCHDHRFIYTVEALEELFGALGLKFRKSYYQDSSSRLGRFDTHGDRFSHPPDNSMYYDVWKSSSLPN